ncbi:MAG: hypothetical protein KF760_21820 [Candidatus Eremiobacteraeota bacterium]|nr:hypothetical protein [Candidatus Eremiobacteraeota bacterium]
MEAEDLFQNLRHGINLFNLLMFYPAPGNEAVVAAVDELLDEHELALAVADLNQLEARLRQLPDGPGPEMRAPDFRELEGGPLRELLQRLAQLNALYLGKKDGRATQEVQTQLAGSAFGDVHTLQLAIARLHQLKAGV